MKNVLPFILCFVTLNLYSQNFCFTKSTSSARVNASTAVAAQPCKNYLIRVYIHRINGQTFSNGYTSSIDNTIINTLNTSLNGYGLFFTLSGSRTWFDDTYANSNTTTLALQGLPNNSNNNFQSNAINIYVLPNNSQISGGFVPASNKQIIMIGGTKSVTHCQPSTTTIAYEIATGRVVSHEMGHCFGLLHTFENSGDDGLSDTPIDNVTNSTGGQACVNFSNCQFTGNCGACTLPSNPTTNMNNFMSYTIPNCMAVFSPMQMDVIRNTINTSLSSVVLSSETTPNLQSMTRDGNIFVNTVNSISSGYHTVNTNLYPNFLTSNVSWVPNNSIWWGVSGTKNISAWLQPSSGQSVTYAITANNLCGPSNRNVTFTVQSGFRISSSQSIKDQLIIEFDNTDYIEALPQKIEIFDEKDAKEEKNIDIKDLFEKKAFASNKKLTIDVKKIKRGVKILRFHYQISTEKNAIEEKIETERVLFID